MKKEFFYCLASDGLIYPLGQHESWEQAEEAAQRQKIDVIWLFGEASAESWKDTLNETAHERESK